MCTHFFFFLLLMSGCPVGLIVKVKFMVRVRFWYLKRFFTFTKQPPVPAEEKQALNFPFFLDPISRRKGHKRNNVLLPSSNSLYVCYRPDLAEPGAGW